MILVGLLAFQTARAAIPGAYVGIGSGVGYDNSGGSAGFAARVFGGYNFNKNFGLEAAYFNYSDYKISGFELFEASGATTVSRSLNAASLVGKGYLPLGSGAFNLYAFGGAAYVTSTTEYNMPTVTKTARGMRPMYGLGAGYSFNKHFTMNIEYSQILASSNSSSSNPDPNIPTFNTMMLNLSYNF